jgi:hypothetical protein
VVSLTLRLPDEIHELVKARAETERRSTNAQIIAMLEAALGMRRAREIPSGKKTYAPDPRPSKKR